MWLRPTNWLALQTANQEAIGTHERRAGSCMLRGADNPSNHVANKLRVWRNRWNRPHVDGELGPNLNKLNYWSLPKNSLHPFAQSGLVGGSCSQQTLTLTLLLQSSALLWLSITPLLDTRLWTFEPVLAWMAYGMELFFSTMIYTLQIKRVSSFWVLKHCKYRDFLEWPYVLLHVLIFCMVAQ